MINKTVKFKNAYNNKRAKSKTFTNVKINSFACKSPNKNKPSTVTYNLNLSKTIRPLTSTQSITGPTSVTPMPIIDSTYCPLPLFPHFPPNPSNNKILSSTYIIIWTRRPG